ncbi:MAG: histidine kinase [Proteobacteria bacterium]|nr:histidine kinase [Pseudomonadota bacterium]MDA1059978.1 histidine kinase [Pseudomonadota bacterium]
MTKILVSPDNPEGLKLETVLDSLRGDLLRRCAHILDDHRPDAATVLRNNIEIMALLGQCLDKAHDSAKALTRLG